MKKFLKNYKNSLILLGSIALGIILGLIFKEDILILKPFGQIFVNLCFTIIVPLVFFTISSAIANIVDFKRLGKLLRTILVTFVVTGIVASLLMVIFMLLINPVGNSTITLEGTEVINNLTIGEQIVGVLTVSDFTELLSKSHMMPLIIFSIFLGIAVGALKEKANHIKVLLDQTSKVMMKLVKYIMYYAPIGMCAYFAVLIAETGPQLVGSYAKSFLIYIPVCLIYFFVFYTLYAYIGGGKEGIKRFYRSMFKPLVTALGTQSSLATLPTNLNAAEEIGIPEDIKNITLPVGANMHMEGSSVGSILKIAFLFTIFGRNFSGISTILTAILIAVISGCVICGVPGGGLVGELLIVSLYGFPASAFPIITAIALIIDAPATALNVVGDLPTSMIVARYVEGKDWIKKKVEKENIVEQEA